jgi:hypothetical protein
MILRGEISPKSDAISPPADENHWGGWYGFDGAFSRIRATSATDIFIPDCQSKIDNEAHSSATYSSHPIDPLLSADIGCARS